MKRREFIILSSIGASSASLLSACGHPEEKLIPAFIPDEEFVPGIDYWKASTCGMCAARCGISVRTREHKANKIEGNRLHPVNRGALCAKGQAGLEFLYNPDRIKGPLKRSGRRGDGRWEEIGWDEAIKTLADRLREIDPNNHDQQALFVTTDMRGITAHISNKMMQALKKDAYVVSPLFDQNGATIDLANSTYLISFGARFLETWRSPVMYSQAYGEFRSGAGKTRGRFVHIEPRMSLTAANADEWLAPPPGTEHLLALAISQVIVRENLARTSTVSLPTDLGEFAPEATADVTEISPETVIRLAREFAKSERPLAIGSLPGPAATCMALLNSLVDNLNKKGGVSAGRSSAYEGAFKMLAPADRFAEITCSRFPEAHKTRQWRLMMIHRFNPIFITPGIRDDIVKTPFIASFSSLMDETTELADLILPDHTDFESWDLHQVSTAEGIALSLTQPVIKPQFDTRQTADVLLAVSRELGGDAAAQLPFESAEEIVKKAATDFGARAGKTDADAFWTEFKEQGLLDLKNETGKAGESGNQPEPLGLSLKELKPGREKAPDYPFIAMVYERSSGGDGSFANLPSLQELPDPMTSVMWGSWLEINPKTAQSLGINDGDLVDVQTRTGSVRLPALIYPGIRPDVVAIPFGQGHSAQGRYAREKGVNPASLLIESQDGSRFETNIRARVVKAGVRGTLIKFGTELQEKMEKRR